MSQEKTYHDLFINVFANGEKRDDRTGKGTISLFGPSVAFDVSNNQFPILTTKKVLWKKAILEMLWFVRGETNIRSLLQENVRIWSAWPHKSYVQTTGDQIDIAEFERRVLNDEAFATQWGSIGPMYGKQWRDWRGADGKSYDQLQTLINNIRNDPYSRRHIVSGWKVDELDQMALSPCHYTQQFYIRQDGHADLIVSQRSCDLYLGFPFNVSGYVALLYMVAQQTDLKPGTVRFHFGDAHIYQDHVDAVRIMLSRQIRAQPTLKLARRPNTINGYTINDFIVEGYDPHPFVPAEVAV